ncbi:MAG: hypothetical protein IPH75_13880 [bacterium]|nr:hypothetical protein [bacterium]
MNKFIIGVGVFSIAIVSSIVSYRRAIKKVPKSRAIDLALFAFTVALAICILAIKGLDVLGWYPE